MNTTSRRRRTICLLPLAAIGALAAPVALAQGTDWPKGQAIKFLVPFTAGSGTDVVARALAEAIAPVLGTTVVIDNKPGAGGTLAAASMVKAPADGYTVMIHSAGHLANPAIYPNLGYDTLADISGVTPLASLPNVMVTSPANGFKDVMDVVNRAKASPAKMNYGSAGNGSATHMNGEKFAAVAGIQALHVPFRGTPEALTETVAGRLHWFFAPMVSALPLIRDGRLQALAVGTSTRSNALPSTPSMAEVGFPAAEYTFWVGMFVSSKTPRPIVERLHAVTAEALSSPAVKDRLDKLGASPMQMTPAQFDKFIAEETQATAKLVKAANIKAD
jgi:tripartite-type tricarboxylate transporter receptor subunit TctC